MLQRSSLLFIIAALTLSLVACGSPAAPDEPRNSVAVEEPVVSEEAVVEELAESEEAVVEEPSPSSAPDASAAAPSLSESPEKEVYAVGDTARINHFLVRVDDAELGAKSDLGEPQAGQQFVLVNVTVENTSGEQQEIAPLLHMSVEDGAGQSYALDVNAGMGFMSVNGPIGAGETATATVGYAVPQDAQDLRWVFRTTEPDAATGIKETGKAVFDIMP